MSKRIKITESQLEYLVKFYDKNLTEQKVDLGPVTITKTKGKEKSGSISEKSTMSFVNRYAEAKKSNNEPIIKFIDKQVTEKLNNKKIVEKLLSGDEQTSLWNEILTKDKYFAADVIKYVEGHNWVQQAILGKKGQKTPEAQKPEEPEKEYPSLDITTTVETPTYDYYEDNKWDLTESGKKDIESNFIQPVIEQLKTSGKGCLGAIKIETSASRFRNTNEAKDLSFEELSKRRSDATYSYVMNRLKEIGINEWCNSQNLFINYKGGNGDGTTGPNPPEGNYYVPKGANSSQAVLKGPNRNEFGEPHKDKKLYNQYKYNRLNLQVAFDFKGEDKLDVPEQPKEIPPSENTEYIVKFYGKTKGKLRWKWDKIFYKPAGGSRPRKATKGSVECPKFGRKEFKFF